MMRPLIVLVLLILLLLGAGRFLVVDNPQPADAIVVLAGETDVRPQRALELLRQHLAPRLLLDVSATQVLYDRKQTEVAEEYVHRLPERDAISICAITGLSTAAEAA